MNTTKTTYRLQEEDDGFVVHYLNDKGSCVWSEFYKTHDEVLVAYRDELAAGLFVA